MIRRLLLCVALGSSIAACHRTVTPDELEAYEARDYPGRGRDEVLGASVVAVRSLGFRIAAIDVGNGQVKTMPRSMLAHSSYASYNAPATTNDWIAWTIDVTRSPKGAHVHAEPRLYSSGGYIESTNLDAIYAERVFSTLYREIDTNLASPAHDRSPTAAR